MLCLFNIAYLLRVRRMYVIMIYYDANVKRNLIVVEVNVLNLRWKLECILRFSATFFLQS